MDTQTIFGKKIHNSGFTLLEFVIAIAISSMLVGIGTVKYLDFNRSQKIKSVGLSLKNNIRDIQGKAVAGVKPTICVSPVPLTLDGYQVGFENNGVNCPGQSCVTVQARCQGANQGPIVAYNMPQDFFFSPVPASFQFNALGAGVSANRVLTVQGFNTPNHYYYRMCVSTSGDIKECGYKKGDPPPTCSCP